VCGAQHPCERRERRLIGRALAVGVRKDLGGLRCLTLRYSVPLSVWVDPHAKHRRVSGGRYAAQHSSAVGAVCLETQVVPIRASRAAGAGPRGRGAGASPAPIERGEDRPCVLFFFNAVCESTYCHQLCLRKRSEAVVQVFTTLTMPLLSLSTLCWLRQEAVSLKL